jgi:hypothetical protein
VVAVERGVARGELVEERTIRTIENTSLWARSQPSIAPPSYWIRPPSQL